MVTFQPNKRGTINRKDRERASIIAYCNQAWFNGIHDKAKAIYPDLKMPFHPPHITISLNEGYPNPIIPREKQERLFRMSGDLCYTFSYWLEFYRYMDFLCMAIECPNARELRKLMGLNPDPKNGFHITIGKF